MQGKSLINHFYILVAYVLFFFSKTHGCTVYMGTNNICPNEGKNLSPKDGFIAFIGVPVTALVFSGHFRLKYAKTKLCPFKTTTISSLKVS